MHENKGLKRVYGDDNKECTHRSTEHATLTFDFMPKPAQQDIQDAANKSVVGNKKMGRT